MIGNIHNILGHNVVLSQSSKLGIDEQDIMAVLIKLFNNIKKSNGNINFLDIGANQGNFSLLSLFNTNIKCFSFEPNPNTFESLKENIYLNNLSDRVFTYNIGLSSKLEILELKIPLDRQDNGLSTFGKNPKERFSYDDKSGEYEIVNVSCKTLDSVFLQLGIESVDVIKLDTEGAELDIIRGGEGVLRKFKPPIIMEFSNQNASLFGYDRDEILHLLKSYGYEHFNFLPNRDTDIIASEFPIEVIL